MIGWAAYNRNRIVKNMKNRKNKHKEASALKGKKR